MTKKYPQAQKAYICVVNTHRCPAFEKTNIVKNGKRNGKPSFLRKDCGRQFVENPTNKVVDSQTQTTVARLLKERISLRAIGRGCDVSMPRLLGYASALYKNVPPDVGCKNLENLKKEDLVFEIDELCTSVGNKTERFGQGFPGSFGAPVPSPYPPPPS
jgi:transposase-like protein